LARRAGPKEVKLIERKPHRVALIKALPDVARLWVNIDAGDIEAGVHETARRPASAAKQIKGFHPI